MITTYATIQSTSTIQEAIRYASWPYDYSNVTGTFSLWQTNTWGPMLEVGPTYEEMPCLYYDYFAFNAAAGLEIKGQFTTEPTRQVGFYLLNSAQFQRFGSSRCVITDWGWEVYEFGPAGDFNWTVTTTGQYIFLFLSRGFYGGHIRFTAQAYSPVQTTSLSTYVITGTYTIQSSEVLISTQTSAKTQNSTPTNTLVPATILIIAILILAAGFITKARHKSHRQTT